MRKTNSRKCKIKRRWGKKKKRREKGKEGRKVGQIGRTKKTTNISITTIIVNLINYQTKTVILNKKIKIKIQSRKRRRGTKRLSSRELSRRAGCRLSHLAQSLHSSPGHYITSLKNGKLTYGFSFDISTMKSFK